MIKLPLCLCASISLWLPQNARASDCPVYLTPATIEQGETAKISWQTKGIRNIRILGIGHLHPAGTGSITIRPKRSRSYKIGFTYNNGKREWCSQKISVRPPNLDVPPAPTISVIKPIHTLNKYFNDNNSRHHHKMVAEMTPWSIEARHASGGSIDHYFIIANKNTYVCAVGKNIFTRSGETKMDLDSCRIKSSRALKPTTPDGEIADLSLWRRGFSGAFSGHIVKRESGPQVNMFIHGELKNNSKEGRVCVQPPDMGYGQFPCNNRRSFWKSYNAFVSMSSFPFTTAGLAGGEEVVTDHGPVVWPSNGYVEKLDGKWLKATDIGVRHPHSFVDNDYMYLFYQDSGFGKEAAGRGPGIKVARAPITSSGVNSQSFKTYFDGAWRDNSLPKGFDKNNIRKYFARRGGRSNAILWDEAFVTNPHFKGLNRPERWRERSDIINFSVTKLAGTNYYLSVANELSIGVTIRLSRNLVTWSAAAVVPGTEMDFHAGGVNLMRDIAMFYPIAMNNDGGRTSRVDPNNFYIIGVQTKYHAPSGGPDRVVNAIQLKISW